MPTHAAFGPDATASVAKVRPGPKPRSCNGAYFGGAFTVAAAIVATTAAAAVVTLPRRL